MTPEKQLTALKNCSLTPTSREIINKTAPDTAAGNISRATGQIPASFGKGEVTSFSAALLAIPRDAATLVVLRLLALAQLLHVQGVQLPTLVPTAILLLFSTENKAFFF